MAVSQIIDFTTQYNASGDSTLQINIDSWDFVVVQIVNPSGTLSFKNTNDSGAITGSTDGNYITATNWVAVTGTNLATGTGITSLATGGLVKFDGIGGFLQLTGTSVTVDKILVRFYKRN